MTQGLTQTIFDESLALVSVAITPIAATFATKKEMREWAVRRLIKRNIPERLARLAVELAYQILREEQARHGSFA